MPLEHESDSAIARAVRAAGSQSALARAIRKRQGRINEWLKAGQMPADNGLVLAVEAATGVPKEELRPDVYPPTGPSLATPEGRQAAGLEPAR